MARLAPFPFVDMTPRGLQLQAIRPIRYHAGHPSVSKSKGTRWRDIRKRNPGNVGCVLRRRFSSILGYEARVRSVRAEIVQYCEARSRMQ